MVESVDFKVGERKRVAIKIQSICGKPFEVSNAKWRLFVGNAEGELESEGRCGIGECRATETIINALIQPMRKNCIYLLAFEYSINPEDFIYQVKIRVS